MMYIQFFLLAHSVCAKSVGHTKGVKVTWASDLVLAQLRAASVDRQVQVVHEGWDSADGFAKFKPDPRDVQVEQRYCPTCIPPACVHRGPQCYPEQRVWWLHIPKCGSSFHSSVGLCQADDAYKNREGGHGGPHSPLPLNSGSLGNVVSIFRKPAQRLASAWSYLGCCGKCMSWGCSPDTYHEIKGKVNNANGSTAATDDLLGNSFLGCQTNMVLGKACMAGTPSSPKEDAQRAMERVDGFLFVGLLEQWGLSTCLYNYITTGFRFISECQLGDSRSTTSKSDEEYDVAGYPRDEADEALYAHVVKRFNRELRLHGITKQSCSYDSLGRPLDILTSNEFFANGLTRGS